MEKLKIQSEVNNHNAWLSGLYVFDAVSKSLYNNFGRKEGQVAATYMQEPIDFNKKPKTQEEIEREKRKELEDKIKERNRQIREMLNRKK